jgi:sec-independent protein translocase protein TatB
MFGIGFSEIIVLLVILIVFVRPDDLPKFLRTLGRLYGRARAAYRELAAIKDRFLRELDEAAAPDEASSKPAHPAGPAAGPEEPPKPPPGRFPGA